MPKPNRLNMNVRVTAESHGRKTSISRLFTLDLLISWIKKMNVDEYTINGLIALASKYPAAALPSFRKNINLMIQRVQLQRQKDQQGEENYDIAKAKPKHPNSRSFKDTKDVVFDSGPQRVSITPEEIWEDIPQEDTACEIIPETCEEWQGEVCESLIVAQEVCENEKEQGDNANSECELQ
jgi:hypothetical protein